MDAFFSRKKMKNNSSKMLLVSKIDENRKFGRFDVVLKLELEVKQQYWPHLNFTLINKNKSVTLERVLDLLN